jgi:ATP-dependent Lhr-like helicase
MHDFLYLDVPASPGAALATLPAFLADWFRERFGEPTPIQRLAWPALARGGHVLVSAPTGTGKTLAACVPILGDLMTTAIPDGWSDSPLRVVYVAPMKALVNDAARTLETQLDDLTGRLPAGVRLPRIAVRTGDTPARERKRMRDEPPDILLTTPESLAVLLSQSATSELMANLSWVVVDEVHALVGNKRGCDLALSLERLTAGSSVTVRRVGLSATATPLGVAARWLAGTRRECTIARAPDTPPPRLVVEPLPDGVRFLSALVERLATELPLRKTTLVFTNTRGLAERLAWQLRRKLPTWDDRVAVHHSALSAERRREVERRFKAGELGAVVCSTSLELGIDIGSVDLAVLVHPPGDVIRLVQRVGRAGHQPGGLSHGLLLTATPGELLEAAVTAASARSGQCEPLALPDAPLDVLCQQLLGMCAARSWSADDLFALVRRAAPFASLSRRDLDDCLLYLRGLSREPEADSLDDSLVWLPARLREDGDQWCVLDAATGRLLRQNLGTILADPLVPVRLRTPTVGEESLHDTRPIGEIDEAFAERLLPGDRFLLDGRCLEYRCREDGAAVVEEVPGRPRVPVWGGDGWPLSPQLARRLYLLRVQAADALRDGPEPLRRLLAADYDLGTPAVSALAAYFEAQESVSEIPDGTTLLIEIVQVDEGTEYYLHTPLNRPGNDALARVGVSRLLLTLGRPVQVVVADLGLVFRLRGRLADAAGELRAAFAAEDFRADLDAALTASEALRGRFERVARTGLMLLRQPQGKRRKVGGADWAQRRLFELVQAHDADFVLIRQALREMQQHLCDADAAEDYARSLPRITLRVRTLSRPSPFAESWSQREPVAGEAVVSPADALARLHAELIGGVDAGA